MNSATCSMPDPPLANPLTLKPVPKLDDVRALFGLAPGALDIGDQDAGQPDGLDGAHYRYRFFRDCDAVPFIDTSDRFQSLNAWYLSDASFLAYANCGLASPKLDAIQAAEACVADTITPVLARLFRAIAARDGSPADPNVRVFVRSCPLIGDEDDLIDPIQCYAADNGQVAIVAFRGTLPSSLPNWLTDFEATMATLGVPEGEPAQKLPGGFAAAAVHAGFRRATLALLEDLSVDGAVVPGLHSYLRGRFQQNPNLRLWFTGHSLGAALATIAAYEVGNVQALYTYGSPRVGNVPFAQVFSEADIAHYRVVHHKDVVPHVPIPIPLLFGYEHVGALKYIEYEDEDAAKTNEPMTQGVKLYDTTLESQLAGDFANAARWMFDAIGRLKLGFLANKVELLTDHAPIYYSNILWNSFIKERARLLGQKDPG
jgi:triacylglycerol lipase